MDSLHRATIAVRSVLSPRLLSPILLVVIGCGPSITPPAPFTPGTPDDPREIILLARDYAFDPPAIDLVPGETVTFQVVNGGLVPHEAVVGDSRVQDAWEAAEAAVAGAPPGPTPAVSVPPEVAGLRLVVESGKRVDGSWTIPLGAASEVGGWFVGCHIPGHWAEGMVVPVRFIGPDGAPLGPDGLPLEPGASARRAAGS